jgi:hypothetical protein
MGEEKYVFFNLFSKTSELNILQAFRQQQARQIPTMHEPMVNFCSKWIVFIFPEFSDELLLPAKWLKRPKC